jgi:hypothetical protein
MLGRWCSRVQRRLPNDTRIAILVAMSRILHDSEHWIVRAQEARKIADETDNDLVRRSMLKIAEEYELLARRAGTRGPEPAASSKSPRS